MKKEACACLILELFRARGIPASGETIQSIGHGGFGHGGW
jgi:hypothetical protein